MVIEKIIEVGDPLLSKKSKSVKFFRSEETKTIIENLIDSMNNAALVGLSAVQIWENKRIFVTELKATKYRKPKDLDPLRVYINPRITYFSKAQCTIYEGCWSVANWELFWPVRRPKTIAIEAFDENGKKFYFKATWLLARVIQHEYDHLEWITFMEKITDIRKITTREWYMKKMSKIKKKK